jgi:hypothetical protein
MRDFCRLADLDLGTIKTIWCPQGQPNLQVRSYGNAKHPFPAKNLARILEQQHVLSNFTPCSGKQGPQGLEIHHICFTSASYDKKTLSMCLGMLGGIR